MATEWTEICNCGSRVQVVMDDGPWRAALDEWRARHDPHRKPVYATNAIAPAHQPQCLCGAFTGAHTRSVSCR